MSWHKKNSFKNNFVKSDQRREVYYNERNECEFNLYNKQIASTTDLA